MEESEDTLDSSDGAIIHPGMAGTSDEVRCVVCVWSMAGFVVRKSNGMSASLKSTNVGLRGGRTIWLVLWGEPGGLSIRSTGESGRHCVVFTVVGLDCRGAVATGGGALVSVEPSPMLVADCSAARFRGFVGGMLTASF